MDKIDNFIWYKILYPICNPIGLNLPLNLFRHWLGVYPKYSLGGRCQWCGKTKCILWKEVKKEIEDLRIKYEKGLL